MESTKVSSNSEIHLAEPKKVHWALNLEEILYFTPETESKATRSMLKKVKIKFCALKKCLPPALLGICEGDFLRRLQERFARIVEMFSAHYDVMFVEDLNKTWEELFELYCEKYEPVFQR